MTEAKCATDHGEDADEGVRSVVKLLLEGDDDALELGLGLLADVGRHLSNVGVVQGSIDLIQNEEGGRLVAANNSNKKS